MFSKLESQLIDPKKGSNKPNALLSSIEKGPMYFILPQSGLGDEFRENI